MHAYCERLEPLAELLDFDAADIPPLVTDLQTSGLLETLFEKVQGVTGFEQADFSEIDAFSLYRTLLYVVVRIVKPALFVETGTLHGISASFILHAMEHNGAGKLISLDLPSRDLSLADQGTLMLPDGLDPGWIAPESLRHRYEIRLGRAEELLPALFDEGLAPDIFLHDSDHSYTHMMMEMALAYSRMERGLIILDNIELHDAFKHFAENCGSPYRIFSSYDSPERRWQHGLICR